MSTESDGVRILLADDHTLLREALRDVLLAEDDFRIVGEAGDAASVVRVAMRTRPHIVLLDIEMPGSQPADTVRELLAVSPDCQVIILSMYDDPWLVQQMLDIGIRGYLHKSVTRREVVTAIRDAVGDEQRVTVSVSHGVPGNEHSPTALLSLREFEVLTLVARAMSNRQIGARLSITEGTVKRHLRNIFGKLGAVSRIDAVNKATSAAIIKRVG